MVCEFASKYKEHNAIRNTTREQLGEVGFITEKKEVFVEEWKRKVDCARVDIGILDFGRRKPAYVDITLRVPNSFRKKLKVKASQKGEGGC